MKTVLAIVSIIWAVFILIYGFSIFLDTPNQIQRNIDFVEKNIKPSVIFINQFKVENGRLPSNREYFTWHRDYYEDYTSDLNQKVDSLIPGLGRRQYIRHIAQVVSGDEYKFKKADWKKDYAIGLWNGDYWEYYFSWSNSYERTSNSWQDGYIGLGITTTLGLIPLIIWLFINKKKKSGT
ncbi:hypothetical protein TH63_04330 [Rufibacter radiotolerans]|uniref:Uncharacterized protein n=1 Tax=Rufibacter radiotolerans TaxID=1379910 RepID=A0A0H4VMB3_9BACT|nr:hypothetical protein [Rufibacter radiotolerans]AKQ45032.1 hypothetical protein TH63_04330 [Rufibacter radiotolerans]